MNQIQTTQQEPDAGRPSRSLWRNRDFLLLWNGQTISTLGTNISTLALPLLVLALTHSPAQAGLLTATRLLPYLLFSLPAGALLDRWNRKSVMIGCDLVRWLALGSVPLAFALGHLTLIHLYLVAFVEGTAYVFFSLAQIAALPRWCLRLICLKPMRSTRPPNILGRSWDLVWGAFSSVLCLSWHLGPVWPTWQTAFPTWFRWSRCCSSACRFS